MLFVHRGIVVAALAAWLAPAVAADPDAGNGPPAAAPLLVPPVADWPARDAARLADPGQPLGVGPQQPAEPAARVVPPVDAMPPALAGPRSLDACVAIALENHPRITAARAEIRAAQGKAVQARLYPNPVIAGFTPQAAGSDSQWSGTVAQDIVTAGKLRLQQQAALREVQAAEWRLVRARFEVMTAVRRDFYLLLVAQRRQEIFKLLLEIANRSYDIGKKLAEAGEGTRADVLFWSIERDQAEVRLLNAGVTIEADRRRLAVDMAVPRNQIGTVEGDLLARLPDFDIEGLQEAVVSRNALPRAAAAETMNIFRRAQRTAAWYEEGILPKARETVEVTQLLYGQGEVTFLSLLQAQKILTELELAYVEAQAERWTSAVEIANLLQLEVFPPPGDVPAGRAFEGGPKEPVPNVGDRPPPAPEPLPPP
jgi:outer membrane protein TolC